MKRRQKGASAFGWLVALFIGGLLLSLALKVGPLYMDDLTVGKVISSLSDRPGSNTASVTQVRSWIDKGLQTNLAKLDRNEVKLSRENGQVRVDIDYERRINYLYNIDLVLTFNHYWKAESQ
ncbi:MAG: DUF4845 domain-containing protein [Endozoicomonas sp.]